MHNQDGVKTNMFFLRIEPEPKLCVKRHEVGKLGSRLKHGVGKSWLTSISQLLKSGSSPEPCTQCCSAIPCSRSLCDVHVDDCRHTSFRVTVLPFSNPTDLCGRGWNGLNSPPTNDGV